jgi:tRNA (Thr-GGU) A37 N-methylase
MPGDPVVQLYWMHTARRDLIVQTRVHRSGPTGTFALRSPARPNPIALAVVRLLAVDAEAGLPGIDAIDAFDGTPLRDIKPWLARSTCRGAKTPEMRAALRPRQA